MKGNDIYETTEVVFKALTTMQKVLHDAFATVAQHVALPACVHLQRVTPLPVYPSCSDGKAMQPRRDPKPDVTKQEFSCWVDNQADAVLVLTMEEMKGHAELIKNALSYDFVPLRTCEYEKKWWAPFERR